MAPYLPDLDSATEPVVARLLADGVLDEAGLTRARAVAAETGEPLHRLLPRLGLAGEAAVAQARAMV